MAFIDEVSPLVTMSFDAFETFITAKIQADKDYLKRFSWLPNGSQMTLLNYLIDQHQESVKDLREKIDFLIATMNDNLNLGEPLHQAISLGKIQLALHFLHADTHSLEEPDAAKLNAINMLELLKANNVHSESNIDMNSRDMEGRTLLSLALDAKNLFLLLYILLFRPNLNLSTNQSNAKVQFQPIHQAVVLNFADAVRLLAHEGADLANPVGVMKDTPLILAARLGKIDALEALIEFPLASLAIEATNNHLLDDQTTGHTAMDELCARIANNQERGEAIRGVAILLCRRVEPPTNQAMRSVLASNRIELLKAVHDYLRDKPELVDDFVTQCHLAESALHNIVYADHSWGSSIRHLFGIPSGMALLVEGLVSRKHSEENGGILSTVAAETLVKEKDPLKLYAEFVRRYNHAYDSQLITNRWSTMRWMIADGRCDWATVLRYSQNHPTSRTRIIINEMLNPVPRVEEDLAALDGAGVLQPNIV